MVNYRDFSVRQEFANLQSWREKIYVSTFSVLSHLLRDLIGVGAMKKTNRKNFRTQLLFLPAIRRAITLARFARFKRNSRPDGPFRTLEGQPGLTVDAVSHNINPDWMFFPGLVDRPDLIASPLRSLPEIRHNAHRMEVLVVGARTEAEIITYMSLGFHEKRILACDLFSYSQAIDLANVVDLPYADKRFDLVVVGWVLEFVTEVELAIAEIRRVCKPEGLIAVGSMRHPESTDFGKYLSRTNSLDRVWRPQSVSDVLSAFGLTYENVVFAGDILDTERDKRSDIVVLMRNFGKDRV